MDIYGYMRAWVDGGANTINLVPRKALYTTKDYNYWLETLPQPISPTLKNDVKQGEFLPLGQLAGFRTSEKNNLGYLFFAPEKGAVEYKFLGDEKVNTDDYFIVLSELCLQEITLNGQKQPTDIILADAHGKEIKLGRDRTSKVWTDTFSTKGEDGNFFFTAPFKELGNNLAFILLFIGAIIILK